MFLRSCFRSFRQKTTSSYHHATRLYSQRRSRENEGGLFKKMLVDMKASSSDEELRRSIYEFEEKLKELKQSESLKTLASAFSRSTEELSHKRKEVMDLAIKIGNTVQTASQPVQELARKVISTLPDIADTEVARQVTKTVDLIEQSIESRGEFYQYGGIRSKESRMSIENELLTREKVTRAFSMEENLQAGTSIVPVKQKEDKQGYISGLFGWSPISSVIGGIKSRLERSDNFLVFIGREAISSIYDKVSGMFSESETALVVKKVREADPHFSIESFTKLSREYIVPEILEALLTGDLGSLKKWCSEGAFSVLDATIRPSLSAGNATHGRILDLRNVEVAAAKLIEDRPLLVVSLQAQQLYYIKDSSGEVIEGSDKSPETVSYILAFTRQEQTTTNPTGWILTEFAVRDRSSGW